MFLFHFRNLFKVYSNHCLITVIAQVTRRQATKNLSFCSTLAPKVVIPVAVTTPPRGSVPGITTERETIDCINQINQLKRSSNTGIHLIGLHKFLYTFKFY